MFKGIEELKAAKDRVHTTIDSEQKLMYSFLANISQIEEKMQNAICDAEGQGLVVTFSTTGSDIWHCWADEDWREFRNYYERRNKQFEFYCFNEAMTADELEEWALNVLDALRTKVPLEDILV